MGAYSFLDVSVSIDGPGGMFAIDGGGVAEEGISIEPVGDKNTMTIGADGEGMHSLSASKACTVTIKLLKTSPVNAQLMAMYNFQTASSARHGQNTFVVRDSARGDLHTVHKAAFKKMPTLAYAKEGGLVEWAFDGVEVDPFLGGDLFDLI